LVCGAFVVGIESPESAAVRAVDEQGCVLHEADDERAEIAVCAESRRIETANRREFICP
jgi:hypothetical protein